MSHAFRIQTILVKISIVTLLLLGSFAFGSNVSQAATLGLSPNTGVYTAGQTFTTRLVVNTSGAAINAAEATISFNPAQLSVVSVNKGSTFTLWAVEPSFSNTAGTITLGGGSPTGYTGTNGTVLTITWRSKGAGTARVNFSNGSVLAADGRGTNVVRSLNGGSYTIVAADVAPAPETIEYIAPANTPGTPVITSTSHPSDGWSQATTATLSWSLPAGVTEVRTLLDGNSGSIPTRVYESPISSITLDDLVDGVQYFHLQFRNSEGWGRVAHYRLAVDTNAPADVVLSLDPSIDSASPQQTIVVQMATNTAPVVRYLVQLNGGEPVVYEATASSTFSLTDLTPGFYTLIVTVEDAAGNTTVASLTFTIEDFAAPIFTEYPTRFGETVIPVFGGTTKAGATVVVTITGRDTGTAPMVYTVVADAEGRFTVIPDGRFAAGVYEMSAVATDTLGAQSAQSEVIRMVVDTPGYIQFGSWLISVLSVLIPLLALVAGFVLLTFWFLVRARSVRRYVIAETDEALSVLEQKFKELQQTVSREEQNLTTARKTKKLTKAEATLLENMRMHITTAEEAIKKEISDVDDMVR